MAIETRTVMRRLAFNGVIFEVGDQIPINSETDLNIIDGARFVSSDPPSEEIVRRRLGVTELTAAHRTAWNVPQAAARTSARTSGSGSGTSGAST